MVDFEVFVVEFVTVDRLSSGSITSGEITTLFCEGGGGGGGGEKGRGGKGRGG